VKREKMKKKNGKDIFLCILEDDTAIRKSSTKIREMPENFIFNG